MSRIRTALAALILAAALIPATAASASAGPAPSGDLPPLPGCAQTWSPKVGDLEHRVCLKKIPANVTASRSIGCTLTVYENGPYGSAAWARGWILSFCWYGDEWVPIEQNDQASSWKSNCSPGVFYANQPNTHPLASFPEHSTGDFPWGAVPNDSLSSVWMRQNCP